MVPNETTIALPASGRRALVVRLLGEGGQGAVYEVVTEDGEHLALKWYHPHTASPQQRATIADLVDRGGPNERFLWPMEMATRPGAIGFGYVMPLRPPQYVGLAALLQGAIDAPLRVVCTIGVQLADSYLRLHAQGLCYRDISFGNVFFDPATGDTLICDNDNVGLEGDASAVIGTMRFMAPEIVRREARPSMDSDRYSLAVLLFYLLMIGHPLLGVRELEHPLWDSRAEARLFGEDPVFIFDPWNTSNAPAPGLHDSVVQNWDVYPTSLQAMFIHAFTTGLRDPRNGRVMESQWRGELVRCRDLLRPCGRCGASNFFDRTRPHRPCWSCGWLLPPPLTLCFDHNVVVLNEDTKLTAHHVGVAQYDFTTVYAQISRHTQVPGAWGLTNVGPSTWSAAFPDGAIRPVEPGRTVGLIPGLRVNFGSAVGRIDDQL